MNVVCIVDRLTRTAVIGTALAAGIVIPAAATGTTSTTSTSYTAPTTTNSSLPPAPSGLRLVPGDGTVTLTWDRNAETNPTFFGYRVLRQNPGATSYIDITPRRPDGQPGVITTNSFIDRGLTNGKMYCYYVAAVNSSLAGGRSWGCVMLPLPAALSASLSLSPTRLVGGAPGTGTVTLSAAAPSGGVSVSLRSNSGSASVPSSVTISGGATRGTFAVKTSAVTSASTVTISATYGGQTKLTTLAIVPAFAQLGSFSGIGKALSEAVGPAPTTGAQRYYISYSYAGNSADVVAVDPDTGNYQAFPCVGESAAWALAAGLDGKMYVGTAEHGKILQLDPSAGTLTDLGRASSTETYIWQLALGSDNRLYGCTYPNAKLVRYSPQTGRMEDLGRMDPVQQYARFIGASNNGFIYTWVGYSQYRLIAYEISSGQHRDITPSQYPPTGLDLLKKGTDGSVYTRISGTWFKLYGWTATAVAANQVKVTWPNVLRDGRQITSTSDGILTVKDAVTGAVTTRPYLYAGKGMDVWRLGLGPDGLLYGSTILPLHLFSVDPVASQLRNVGDAGGGEVYSFLATGNSLLMAAYTGLSPLMSYQPQSPFDPSSATIHNPALITYPGAQSGWRPTAMIAGPGGDVYIGSIPTYGLLGGALTVLDPVAGVVKSSRSVIANQSVVSLTSSGNLVVGGTSIYGGNGSVPTTTEARLFLWDPVGQKKVFDLVPVPLATAITDLATAGNGLVFGLAGPGGRANQLFVFDPVTRRVVHTARLPFAADTSRLYNCIGTGPDGRLYGLFAGGIFYVDPTTYQAGIVATYPGGISGGFGLSGRNIYFSSGFNIVRYTMP